MLIGDRIVPRPAEKAPLAETSRPSRIEDYAAQIAKIIEREQQLEVLQLQIDEIEQSGDAIGQLARPIMIRLEDEEKALGAQKVALEDLLSFETPATMREAFLMMLLVGWRNANAGMEESQAVDRLIEKITKFLESHSGTTTKELGLGDFHGDERDWNAEALDLIKRAAAKPCQEAQPC